MSLNKFERDIGWAVEYAYPGALAEYRRYGMLDTKMAEMISRARRLGYISKDVPYYAVYDSFCRLAYRTGPRPADAADIALGWRGLV